ncbi:alpha-L-rhamnosidase [Edaphobacter aggregans]|uniref:alpha-L-rhamnosidase n=1 Tax=Edaphobacter aggregans TaxID=570835 RepID=A0A3R9P8M2_9BACT|nr:alpha-L-rhamnosidase [Edaphobacter aggregans]RSL15942.1 alpha-L-rhamnosidase [Edaphobacter aggregans]
MTRSEGSLQRWGVVDRVYECFRIAAKLVVLLALLFVASAVYAAPVRLRVEQRTNPLGIDVARPVFTWQSDAAERDWKQSAYRILVASSAAALGQGKGDVWDSGRVDSSESVGIAYGGPELKSRQRYFWTVEVWDGHGTAARVASPAWWEMGLLQPGDWKAEWIRRNDPDAERELHSIRWIALPEAEAGQAAQPTTAEFEYKLHLDKKPLSASLHVFSPGTFTARVNGAVTGHKSEWNSFDREDVRDRVVYGDGAKGDNVIVVSVAAPKSRDAKVSLPAALAAVLRIDGGNAKARDIVTDAQWQVRKTDATEWSAAKDLGSVTELRLGTAADHMSLAEAPERVSTDGALFRREFGVSSPVVSARLYVTALGSYRAYLNGKQVGDGELTPDFTDYRKRVVYQTYDVTPMIAKGQNVLAAMLGAGWHGSPMMWSGVHIFPGPDLLRAQLEITSADGSKQVVATDTSWKSAAAPIVSSEIYAGEAYDARLVQAGWNAVHFAGGRGWNEVVTGAPASAVQVSAQSDLPVHLVQTVKPVAITMTGGDAVFDMGQNMVGTVRLRVRGPRGTTVRMRFAERLNPDGTVYTENLRNADATDLYTLSGEGEEVWEPAFTFHGFRYVQVSGLPGKPVLGVLEGQVLNSLPETPSFRLKTSSELLNRMYELGIWGQRGNFVSIPTDCPQRDERLGWMGDAGVFWRTGTYNFDIDSFSHKFMQDVVDGQSPGGALTDVSPNLLNDSDEHPGAPGWGDAGVLVPYATWMQYGDRAVLERNWPAMEKWMDYILRTNPNYLRQKALGNNYADWLAPEQKSPKDLVATAYWALLARQMREMSTALGRSEDAEKYRQLYEQIAAAYRKEYVHEDGSVAGDTQTAYLLTLYVGLAPKELEANLTARLVKDIEAHENHLTTGFLGTPFLLFVLEEQGRADVAYRLLLNDTYPSWGYMVKKGATTWWERWNGDTGDPSMNSYNHYAFGSVMAWVYRRVAGIDTDAAGAGFHHLVIRPHIDASLGNVHAEYDSAYGLVTTDWTRGADGGLQLNVHTPANTTATVYVPGAASSTVTQDGQALNARREGDAFVTSIGSGTYKFAVH